MGNTQHANGSETMILDKGQGTTEHDRKFGYVAGYLGGYFFTWMPTLSETLDTVEADEQDGDGGLEVGDVREFLVRELADDFDD